MAGPIRCSSLTLTHEDYKKHETNIFTEHVPLEINHTFRKTKTVSVFRYRRSTIHSILHLIQAPNSICCRVVSTDAKQTSRCGESGQRLLS